MRFDYFYWKNLLLEYKKIYFSYKTVLVKYILQNIMKYFNASNIKHLTEQLK